MTDLEVLRLTDDGTHVVLLVDGQTVEVPLDDIRRAERRAARALTAVDENEPLTPRLIQQRIRCGESAQEVALSGGWPVEAVVRYQGPPLAEREHQAAAARRAEVDGRLVEDLVAGHLGLAADDLEWDSWLVDDGRWEVRVAGQGQAVRLRWDPAARRVQAIDEPGRRALRVATDTDALTAVLRPVSTGAPVAPPPAAAPAARRHRAEVPLWDDISSQVTGRERPPDLP